MTPPLAPVKKVEIVVIQKPEGNPETIDAGERIAVVGSDGGHLSADQVAPTLAALGIQKIPVGTKIRDLEEYVERIQRAFRPNLEGTLLFSSINVAQRTAEVAGIQVKPKDLPIVRKNFTELSRKMLKKALQSLDEANWIGAHNLIKLAEDYAQRGEFSSELSSSIEQAMGLLMYFRRPPSFGPPIELDWSLHW